MNTTPPITKLLKDVADIRTGFPFRQRAERVASGGCRLVQMRDIDGATGCLKGHFEQVETPANWQIHRLYTGDVVMTARGERNDAAQFVGDDKAVAASHLLVLRLKATGEVIPPYLVWYLNLPQTQERLRRSRAGSGIPFLPIDGLGQLEIPVPSIEMQNHLVNLHQLSVGEQRLMTQIQEKRRELMSGVLQRLLTGQLKT